MIKKNLNGVVKSCAAKSLEIFFIASVALDDTVGIRSAVYAFVNKALDGAINLC